MPILDAVDLAAAPVPENHPELVREVTLLTAMLVGLHHRGRDPELEARLRARLSRLALRCNEVERRPHEHFHETLQSMTHDDKAGPSTEAQRSLSDYCEYLPDCSRRPCYAPASLVLVRPDGEALRFTCADHLPAWASRIRGGSDLESFSTHLTQ